MIEQGVPFGHVDTHGDYLEIDTQEDFDLAQRGWGVSAMTAFPTSVVGSLPRPQHVRDLIETPTSD